MKVFLSWSGDRSRAIAEVLKSWLPSVLQAVKPYFSPEDTAKGSRWSSEIAKELEASRVALFIITPENQEAPWLLFEAGALSRDVDRTKVCPLLFGGMAPTDLKGPLVQFQAARFCADEMKKVLKSVNQALGELALLPDVLEKVFERWWPDLEDAVEKQLTTVAAGNRTVPRSERDLLEEVLALTRHIDSRDMSRMSRFAPPPVAEDLLSGVVELMRFALHSGLTPETEETVRQVDRAVRFLLENGAFGPRRLRFSTGVRIADIEDELRLLGARFSGIPEPVPMSVRRENLEPVAAEAHTEPLKSIEF